MTHRIATLVAVVAVGGVAASTPGASPATRHPTQRLAGPWYTPAELQALIAFSNATFAGQKAQISRAGRP